MSFPFCGVTTNSANVRRDARRFALHAPHAPRQALRAALVVVGAREAVGHELVRARVEGDRHVLVVLVRLVALVQPEGAQPLFSLVVLLDARALHRQRLEVPAELAQRALELEAVARHLGDGLALGDVDEAGHVVVAKAALLVVVERACFSSKRIEVELWFCVSKHYFFFFFEN
jgi:hypothetical protein